MSNDIPEEILNGFVPEKEKKQRYDTFNAIARKSNFQILINPNVSHKGLNKDGRVYVYNKLMSVGKQLEEALSKQQLLIKKGGYDLPCLTSFSGKPELGQKKGFIHVMFIAKFDGYCHLDMGEIQTLVRSLLHPFKPLIRIKYFQDTGAVNEAYVNKASDIQDIESKAIDRGLFVMPKLTVNKANHN